MALGCTACGVQGPPHPPRLQQPQPVKDLRAMQVGESLRLSFTLPRLAADGERLTKPQEVEILREVRPASESPPGAEVYWELWQKLDGEDVQKQLRGDSVTLTVPLAGTEPRAARIQLAVRTLTRGFRNHPRTSELSNVATLSLLQVPEAIQGLRATTTEHAVELTWNTPAQPVTSYRVSRSTGEAADSFKIVGDVTSPPYGDSDFKFGRTYRYRVSAVVKGLGSVAESEDSAAIEITPRDTFPPQAPQSLTALYTREAVELIWDASPEADLRGYNLYRREDGSSARKLNAQPLSTPTFRDTRIVTGGNYSYRVTALDTAGNESSPSAEAVAKVP